MNAQQINGIEKKFFELSQKVCQQLGYALYDLEYIAGQNLLRVYIQDPNTESAQLDDCVNVDRAMTEYIETEPWMPEALILEVSSPGIYRQLKTKEHFKAVEGKDISLTLNKKIDDIQADVPKFLKGQRKVILNLNKVNDLDLTLKVEDVLVNIAFEDIKKANLEPNIDFEQIQRGDQI